MQLNLMSSEAQISKAPNIHVPDSKTEKRSLSAAGQNRSLAMQLIV